MVKLEVSWKMFFLMKFGYKKYIKSVNNISSGHKLFIDLVNYKFIQDFPQESTC